MGGKLRDYDGYVVTGYDKESKSYTAQKENDSINIPRKTFENIIEQPKKGPVSAIVFENKDKGVKGTVIPEFSFQTREGLKVFKDCVVTKHDPADGTYTLSNGETSITLTKDRFLETIAPERFSQNFNKETTPYEKMLKGQYEDYFKERENTAYNFIHNFSVKCRKEARNPCDALLVAKAIINRMNDTEQEKLMKTLDAIKGHGQNLNVFIVDTYHEAISNSPIPNDGWMKKNYPNDVIAQPFYDTVSANGHFIDDNPELYRNGKNFNLKIGDSVKDITINTAAISGKGTVAIKYGELKVVSASKEGNSLTLIDKSNSYFTVPRDSFLKSYEKQLRKNMHAEIAHQKKNSVAISYGYV